MTKVFRILTLLTIFLALSVSFGCSNDSFAKSNGKIPAKTQLKSSAKTIVYYFYSKPRCISCKNIETYTREVVTDLKNPNVEFKIINLDEPSNNHYAKDYKLFTKSVVLSKVKNGKEIKSKNLTDIWTKLGNEKAFKKYIIKEIKSF